MSPEEDTLYTEIKTELEASFASPFNDIENYNPLDIITVNLSSTVSDSDIHNYPEYPNIVGSWDDVKYKNIKDRVSSDEDSDIPLYLGLDKDYLNPRERKLERQFGEVISKFRIFHHEWEMDGHGYIVKTENGNKIIRTDHGKPFTSNKEYVENLIKTYKEVIQETESALFLLK